MKRFPSQAHYCLLPPRLFPDNWRDSMPCVNCADAVSRAASPANWRPTEQKRRECDAQHDRS
jgi:hypothetical protein